MATLGQALAATPLLTTGVDIESAFLYSQYLAEQNTSFTKDEFADILERVITDSEEDSIKKYVNGRVDILRKAWRQRKN